MIGISDFIVLCFYIGIVSSATVYLNQTESLLKHSLLLNQGFEIGFRACSNGTILQQKKDGIKLSITATTSTSHGILEFKWTNNGTEYIQTLSPKFSMDSNVLVDVSLAQLNNTLYELTLSTDKTFLFSLNRISTFIASKTLLNVTSTDQILLGSKESYGCFYSSPSIPFGDLSSSCPLDNLHPCGGLACPSGYSGRFCEEDIDECQKYMKCNSFSTCVDLVNSFQCICGPQYTGQYCETFLGSPCTSSICKNGGICLEDASRNNYTCTCPPNYTGLHCENLFFPCMSSPCGNGGTCRNNTATSYQCSCNEGFSGINCEKRQNPCAVLPCGNGQCIQINHLNYTCNCTGSGLYGDKCQYDVDECLNSPCQNGTCRNVWRSYHCDCTQGFTGKNCEENIDDCAKKVCVNGTCVDLIDDYKCNCLPGFEGKNCSTDIDECITLKKCVNSNRCINLVNDYQCICKQGYTGKDCDVDINECLSAPCKNNATCKNVPGNFSCDCQPGYNGFLCETNIDDCNPNPCNNGSCRDLVNNYTCNCPIGFTGRNCEINKDECDPNPCLNYGKCIDGINNYTCKCIPSYTGRNCTIFQDPCQPKRCQNGGVCLNDTKTGYKCNCTGEYGGDDCEYKLGPCFPNPCENEGLCNETKGSYNCTCQPGFKGANCSTDINECQPKNPCQNGGTCSNTFGSYYCNCTNGYEGKQCENDINECDSSPCNPKWSHSCLNLNGSFQCFCFVDRSGRLCNIQTLFCKPDSCSNGANCSEIDNSDKVQCNCAAGFTGSQCEENIDECKLKKCRNNSTCNDLVNDYNCTCLPGYEGRDCETEIDECKSNPCEHNSTCRDFINTYVCDCKKGYNGTNCDNDIDWCKSSPCQNGGSCIDGIETHTCQCVPGFTGLNCEVDIKDCEPNPCVYIDQEKNVVDNICIERSNFTAMTFYNESFNATTYNDRDGYICRCVEGLKGVNCSEDSNDCTKASCHNNATCVDLVNSVKCVCPAGFTGMHCEVALNPCSTHQCQNEGDCKLVGSTPTCVCQYGFYGDLCEKSTTVNFPGNSYWIFRNNITMTNLTLRFITTVADSVVVSLGDSSKKMINIIMKNGNLQVEADGKNQIIFSGTLNNNQWHTLVMTKNADIYKFIVDASNFIEINLALSELIDVSIGHSNNVGVLTPPDFVGCIQDVIVSGIKIFPTNGIMVNVTVGKCQKKNVCNETSCSSKGMCIDLWNRRKCNCFRQYFGEDCEKEITSFNFQSISTNATRRRRSARMPYVSSNITLSIANNYSFSFLIRTRQANGFVSLLVTATTNSNLLYSYVLYTLHDGYLKVTHHLRSDRSNPPKPIVLQLPFRINDGEWHEVIHNNEMISENNVNTIFTFQNHIDPVIFEQVFLGDIGSFSVFNELGQKSDLSFDGCLQAIKVGDSFLTNQIIENSKTVSIIISPDVRDGCQGSPVCQPNPCQNHGVCKDLWNKFNCTCEQDFTGDNCTLYGCQHVNTCPESADCIDIIDKPGKSLCSTASTYNGYNTSSTIHVSNGNITTLSLQLRTREANTFIMASYIKNSAVLVIGVNMQGKIEILVNRTSIQNVTTDFIVNDGEWHNITLNENLFQNAFSDKQSVMQLLTNTTLIIGKASETCSYFTKPYLGCLKSVLINGDLGSINTTTALEGCHSDNKSCNTSPCVHGTCRDSFYDYTCECSTFYTSKTCNETVNVTCEFWDGICRNGSFCNNIQKPTARNFSDHGMDYFKCVCAPGLEGYYCDQETNDCSPNPCQNGGNCTDQHLNHTCTCARGWQGQNCSVQIDDCLSNPCQNTGVCIDKLNDYDCNCTANYKGKNCTEDVNECEVQSNICLNDGTCQNLYGDFNCSCTSNYFGKICEYNNTQACEKLTPCLHRGVCSDDITGYNCTCKQGFSGKICENDFPECETLKPCFNGTCSDSHSRKDDISGYNCICTAQYTGRNCSEEVNPCIPNPCENNGNCTKVSYNKYLCSCSGEYSGLTCTSKNNNLSLIIGLVVAGVIIIIIIIVIIVLKFFRDKSGMEGTYSPNKEEQQVGNVEMNTLKKPNTERLI